MTTPTLVVPSRQRIRRACDHCRRRKTRCDGQSNCKPCFDTGLQCSYDRQKRRMSGPKYIAHLEQKLHKLKTQVPETSSDRNTTRQGSVVELNTELRSLSPSLQILGQAESVISKPSDRGKFGGAARTPPPEDPNEDLVEALGTSCKEGTSYGGDTVAIYRGKTTGVEIVRNLRRLCDSFLGLRIDPDNAALKIVDALDSPFPTLSLSSNPSANIYFSSETSLRRWIDLAFSQTFVLWSFIDRGLFDLHVQRLLGQGISGRNRCDGDHLGLIHAIIALGQRHDAGLGHSQDNEVTFSSIPGFQHFEAARDLVPLMQCSRSVTAVQTVLCMALYLKSIAAQRMVHTYISMAGHAAHQLGLHEAASDCFLPEQERAVRRQVFVATRTFDAYVTCSLGLPRNLRALGPAEDLINAPHIDGPEMLLATNANVEVLEILGHTREKVYMTDTFKRGDSSTVVDPRHLQDLSRALDLWALKYPIFAQVTNDNLATCTKAQLFLKYSQCFVLLELYCPFVHHIASPRKPHSPNAYAYGLKCVEAAISAVRTAEVLAERGMLYEAYALTVDVLVMAATTLLVVELGGPLDTMAETVRRTNLSAKSLLESLAHKNWSATKCLESLSPLYRSTTPPTPPSSTLARQSTQDFPIFQQGSSEVPVFDFELAAGSQALASTFQSQTANFNSSIVYPPHALIDDAQFSNTLV